MSRKTDSLHERAEMCRWEAQNACDDYNSDSEQKAVDEFEAGEVAEYFRGNAAYVTGLAIKRLNAVKDGKPTFPFRAFDADTLVRLLSSDTEVEYDAMGWDEELSDEATIAAAENDDLTHYGFSSTVYTPTTEAQCKLRCAMIEYAKIAAAYAKSIGSGSLMDWVGIVDILENQHSRFSSHLSQDDAKRVVELEKSAADRLRLDKIIAELPPFKTSKKTKKAS